MQIVQAHNESEWGPKKKQNKKTTTMMQGSKHNTIMIKATQIKRFERVI